MAAPGRMERPATMWSHKKISAGAPSVAFILRHVFGVLNPFLAKGSYQGAPQIEPVPTTMQFYIRLHKIATPLVQFQRIRTYIYAQRTYITAKKVLAYACTWELLACMGLRRKMGKTRARSASSVER